MCKDWCSGMFSLCIHLHATGRRGRFDYTKRLQLTKMKRPFRMETGANQSSRGLQSTASWPLWGSPSISGPRRQCDFPSFSCGKTHLCTAVVRIRLIYLLDWDYQFNSNAVGKHRQFMNEMITISGFPCSGSWTLCLGDSSSSIFFRNGLPGLRNCSVYPHCSHLTALSSGCQ